MTMNFGVTEVPKAQDIILRGLDFKKPIDRLIAECKMASRWNAVRKLEQMKAAQVLGDSETVINAIPHSAVSDKEREHHGI